MSKIEVEAKFPWSDAVQKNIDLHFIATGEVLLHDIYFDTPDFRLALANNFLRIRGGACDLKVPQNEYDPQRPVYTEIKETHQLVDALCLNNDNVVKVDESCLISNGYCRLVELNSRRMKYVLSTTSPIFLQKNLPGTLRLDVDYMQGMDPFIEIELRTYDPQQIAAIQKLLFSIAKELGCQDSIPMSKFRLKLRQTHRALDSQLVAKGIFPAL